jgi:hypothetical protein
VNGAFFVTNAQSSVFKEPSENPFDNTSMFTQATVMFCVSLRDQRFYAVSTQRLANHALGIVSSICKHLVRTFSTNVIRSLDWQNSANERNGLLGIGNIRGSMQDRQ